MGKQQLENIIRFGQLPTINMRGRSQMFVRIDKAGQHIATFAVNDLCVRRRFGCSIVERPCATNRANLRNAVSDDFDIDGTVSWGTCAVDHMHIGNDQPSNRTLGLWT